MASILEDCPKQKPKAKAFGFHSFLGPGSEVYFSESFGNNVRVFLRECGEREDYTVEGMPIWCTLLVDEKSSVAIPFYVVEETVMCSSNPFLTFGMQMATHSLSNQAQTGNLRLPRELFDVPYHLLVRYSNMTLLKRAVKLKRLP